MAKRLFDLVVAGIALVLLAPLLALVAAWVSLDSRGPVFFRQQRVGRHGVPFRIHKFRTMVVDAETAGPQISTADDPRITRAGRVLRRTKLDELPQLLDVLEGSMSLVGPRPEVPRYVALYTDEQRARILSVRPGITDLASLAFRDEGELLRHAADPEHAYVHDILPRKLRLAEDYIAQASLATDLALLVRTLAALLAPRPRQRRPH